MTLYTKSHNIRIPENVWLTTCEICRVRHTTPSKRINQFLKDYCAAYAADLVRRSTPEDSGA